MYVARINQQKSYVLTTCCLVDALTACLVFNNFKIISWRLTGEVVCLGLGAFSHTGQFCRLDMRSLQMPRG